MEWLLAGVVGLCIGSFLGLAAWRLPRMIERRIAIECAQWRGESPPEAPRLDLWSPASHCPACGTPLSVLENLPLLAWLLQSGRCRHCGAFIGWREPLMEVASALLAMAAVWRWGWSPDAALVAVFFWTLLLASAIDLERQWLPDELTLPLLWLGLLANLDGRFAALPDAVLGAAAGYLSLWAVYHAFRLATGREGLGEGDFKLLAAIGAWCGWQVLPQVVLVGSLLGAVAGLAAMRWLGHPRQAPLPFGPALAIGGALALWFGDLLALSPGP